MKKIIKKNKGITLVALVVTIIILLILAGISIITLTGSGLFENARLAEQKYKNAQELENLTLKDYENKIGEYVSGNRDFKNDSTIISDFTPITSSDFGNTIAIDANTSDTEDIRGYIYMIDNEVRKVTEDKYVEIGELIENTSYTVKVIAIDKNGKTRISKEISQKTAAEVYLFKDGKVNSEYTLTGFASSNGGAKIHTDNRYYLYASYASHFGGLYSEIIDFTKIKGVKVNVEHYSDGVTGTFTIGLQSNLTKDTEYDEGLSVSEKITTSKKKSEILLDTTNVTGNKYFKISGLHDTTNGYSIAILISSIVFIYK